MHLIERAISSDEVVALCRFVAGAAKRDGRATAGRTGQHKKACEAVRSDAEGFADAARRVERSVLTNPRVAASVFPRAVSTVQFLRYGAGGRYDAHVDMPLMGGLRGTPVRADLSATLFLNEAYDHDGGDLIVAGQPAPRGRAGDLLLYDGGQEHAVEPITRGQRIVAVFWIESFVARAEDRAILRDLDAACAPLRADGPAAARDALADVYVRLLRRFSVG